MPRTMHMHAHFDSHIPFIRTRPIVHAGRQTGRRKRGANLICACTSGSCSRMYFERLHVQAAATRMYATNVCRAAAGGASRLSSCRQEEVAQQSAQAVQLHLAVEARYPSKLNS
jgi:hypothetical protein